MRNVPSTITGKTSISTHGVCSWFQGLMFSTLFPLRLTSVRSKRGYCFAGATGGFFIQPLGTSCGFGSAAAAPAVVSEPIPHPHRRGETDKVCRFPPSPWAHSNFPPVPRWEKSPVSVPFPSPPRVCVHKLLVWGSETEQGRTRGIILPALDLAQLFSLLIQEPAPEPEYLATDLSETPPLLAG